jgi:UDP-N-acetylmuramoylalanine-D-glutamate ligase
MTTPLRGKRAVVLGFARQGRALARWLPAQGASVVVSDLNSAEALGDLSVYPDVEFVLGQHPASLLDGADLLCISGGVPLELEVVQAALRRGIPLTNDAQLFLERCPAPVIGITGSAGKTTTTTLAGDMLRQAGYRTWVGGNIGDVLLDVLADIQPDDRVVMELSSFQLEIMTASPQWRLCSTSRPTTWTGTARWRPTPRQGADHRPSGGRQCGGAGPRRPRQPRAG